MDKICYKCDNLPICKHSYEQKENYCDRYDEPLPYTWLVEEALSTVENYEQALKVIEQEQGSDMLDYIGNLMNKLPRVEDRWQFMDVISNAVEAGVCSRL